MVKEDLDFIKVTKDDDDLIVHIPRGEDDLEWDWLAAYIADTWDSLRSLFYVDAD